MKAIIFLLFFISFVASAFSQSTVKAPFDSKLLDKEIVVNYERLDGSVLSRYNNAGSWYITKEATDASKMNIPSCVAKQKPTRIIYETLKGEEFSTYDLNTWVKYSEITSIQTENSNSLNILEITSLPTEPVNNEFSIGFSLKNESVVKIIITDIQGRVLNSTSNTMKSGLNHFEVNVEGFNSGTYTYKTTAGLSFYSGIFIKI